MILREFFLRAKRCVFTPALARVTDVMPRQVKLVVVALVCGIAGGGLHHVRVPLHLLKG